MEDSSTSSWELETSERKSRHGCKQALITLDVNWVLPFLTDEDPIGRFRETYKPDPTDNSTDAGGGAPGAAAGGLLPGEAEWEQGELTAPSVVLVVDSNQ
jgi:hypothetical protein